MEDKLQSESVITVTSADEQPKRMPKSSFQSKEAIKQWRSNWVTNNDSQYKFGFLKFAPQLPPNLPLRLDSWEYCAL